MTELVTGLGMLGGQSLERDLELEPREMISVAPELWQGLRAMHAGGLLRAEFVAAWTNGQAFLAAEEGLRGRIPRVIEWKGAIRAPGDEVVPADLRIDHVYLVSCKYLSAIVLNTSPAHVFDRLLSGGHGIQGVDWYSLVADSELEGLYRQVVDTLGLDLPDRRDALSREQRRGLSANLRGRWPASLRPAASAFAVTVAERSAERWRVALGARQDRQRLLWRLLRIGSAPYFVLGADDRSSLRLRIETPWDWSQRYQLVEFHVSPRVAEQPVVDWAAAVDDRLSGARLEVTGHVEIRWSHGKFNGPPEAKVYLDTPHHRVPGYVPLT